MARMLRAVKRLFSRWAIPGWCTVLFWFLLRVLEWSDRLASAREKLLWMMPVLQKPLLFLSSSSGQLLILIAGLVLLFVASWRKEDTARVKQPTQSFEAIPTAESVDSSQQSGEKRERHSSHNSTTQRTMRNLIYPRLREWERLREDFESAARAYHDVEFEVFFVTREKALATDKFRQPHYAINLWQFFGALPDDETRARIHDMKLTNFGLTGAELTAVGIIIGNQTELFRKMATRAGTLLPDEINMILISEISKRIEKDLSPAKPVFATNGNALAKWLNLVLIVTSTWHSDRFRNFKLQVDPFTASLSVFDEFDLSDKSVKGGLTPQDILSAIKCAAPFMRPQIGENFTGLEVEWRLKLRQVLRNRGVNDAHLVFETGEVYPLVVVDTSTASFPFLKSVHEGSEFLVTGRVSHATEFEITLSDAKLTLCNGRYASPAA
jgi:hypothetical protein